MSKYFNLKHIGSPFRFIKERIMKIYYTYRIEDKFMEHYIPLSIEVYQEFGLSRENIYNKIKNGYSLTEKQADYYMKRYWKKPCWWKFWK